MALLRDMGSEEFETAAGDPPFSAGDRWLVLLDSGGRPVSALEPRAELDAATPPPPIIVAPPGLDVNIALTSAAFAEANDVSAVVLVAEDRVVGVWGGPSLVRALKQGPRVTRGGPVLPGVPQQIPLMTRSCTYLERGTLCGTQSSFVKKPFPMPNCRNDRNLSAHPFGW